MGKELEEEIEEAKGAAQFYNEQAMVNVGMVLQLAENCKPPFLHTLLRGRLATMVDCYLNKLANRKKRRDFAAENLKELKFEPSKLLVSILKIFLTLSDSDDFLNAVAED